MRERVFTSSLARFIAVGISNATIGYVTFMAGMGLLEGRPWRAASAQIISYALVIVWSFYWNRRWTFAKPGYVVDQGMRFLIVQAALLVLSAASLSLTVDVLDWPPTPCWIGIMAFITILHYACLKHWVF